ncbi:hypothetical protein DFJ63DRAFT_338030 [Scheffersomyces coipomensis]|uniref:uncharacterized protein n=1 Tax=Scheffersomyces coipomensis TaxID=1788519 RepID=UPI00315D9F9B
MSASPANELASPSATSTTYEQSYQPKSFQRKEFQVSSSTANATPPAQIIPQENPVPVASKEASVPESSVEIIENNEVNKEKEVIEDATPESGDDDSKKISPSSQKFLSNLKSFNIDRTKYKHYGHQSSMNAQSLTKIISEAQVKQEYNSSNNSPISNNRIVIDERISQILGLPQQVTEEESFWPYNIDTLNEILRFKVEQEKTRQESIKSEFGTTAVELLKLAKSMNISGDLIPFLFISNAVSVDNLKVKIEKLKNEPQELIDELAQNSRELAPEISRFSSIMSHNNNTSIETMASSTSGNNVMGLKRKFSDTQLPSFSETAESIKASNSSFVSPTTRSPNKSPTAGHRRVSSDTSEATKVTTSPPSKTHLPLPPTSYPQLQQQPSHQQQPQHYSPDLQPQMAPQNTSYPVYYTPQPMVHPKDQAAGKVLGSPYSQKYQPVLYQTPGPHSVPPQSQPPQAHYQGEYIAQPPQQHYQYYIPSPPNNAGQYMIQGPGMVRMPPQQQPQQQRPPPPHHIPPPPQEQPVPTHQFQSPPDSSNNRGVPIFKSAEIHEDTSPYKKQRSSSKNTSINFMITTPKNPPARKYNNPHKDK